MRKTPKLTLVGAGPGDPELITIKGVKAIQAADVILYDALVDPELLSYASDALHIPVGKRAGRASISQNTINALIVEYAWKYGHVVRLKGGDPFVFARGLEERAYAEKHGIPTEVVLGVSCVMLPGLFGIPLTCRGINQSFSVVTATTHNGELSKEVLKAAECSPTTLFFMGLGKLELIVEAYLANDRGDLPVAIISKGSHKDGSVYKGEVRDIVKVTLEKQPEAPALLIFGEGAAYANNQMLQDFSWQQDKVVA